MQMIGIAKKEKIPKRYISCGRHHLSKEHIFSLVVEYVSIVFESVVIPLIRYSSKFNF